MVSEIALCASFFPTIDNSLCDGSVIPINPVSYDCDGAGNCYVLTPESPWDTDGCKLEKFNSSGVSQWEVVVGLENRTAISGYPTIPSNGMDLEHDRDGLIWVVGQAEGAAATVLKTFDEADGTAGPYSWNRPDSDQYLQAISTRRGFLVGDAP